LENINTQLESISSTVGTYGTIALENAPLAVNKGGTATTTSPSDGKYLGANGSTPTWKSFVGAGGVTVSTSTTSTIISSTGFDSGSNYTLTGGWVYNSSSTFNSTTTLNGNTNVPGNRILGSNGYQLFGGELYYATSTVITSSVVIASGLISLYSFTVGAGDLTPGGSLEVTIPISNFSATNSSGAYFDFIYGTASTTILMSMNGTTTISSYEGEVTFKLINDSTSSQYAFLKSAYNHPSGSTFSGGNTEVGSYSTDSTTSQTFSVKMRSNGGIATTTSDGIIVKRFY
jgi:hypothetical protein